VGTLTCDRKPYLDKIGKLKASLDGIYNCHKGSYIVSLSRKGPRLLEKLYKGETRQELNTVTEFALPFLFNHLVEISRGEDGESALPDIHIVDDAIYYGSTIEGLWKEIRLYERLFGLDDRINHTVHACIKSKHSKSLEDLKIQADSDIPDGFEHYFVKCLTADLRTLNKCFEVEFPIVTYRFKEAIDIDVLVKRICKVYGERNSYRIDYHDTTEDKSDKVITSVNILLEKGNAIFRKMRCSISNHVIRIACMAPRNIHTSYRTLAHMFLNTEVSSVWKWAVSVPSIIVNKINPRKDSVFAYNDLIHNVMKSLVALANYFYSYNILIDEKETLQGIFAGVGRAAQFEGVDERDIFYLLGDRDKASSVRDVLMTLYELGKPLEPQTQSVGDVSLNYQVFEQDFPKGLIENIELQNKMLLDNCSSMPEALSAMFFNQTLLLDNGTRDFQQKNDNTRLRFGQTYGSLFKNLSTFGKDIEKDVHRWIDRSIDQGSIVPQYVHDPLSHYWTRVFRPGENEDEVLGQLSRLATFCFTRLDNTIGAGWVPEELISEMLSVVCMKSRYNLSKELGLELSIDNRHLYFKTDDMTEATEVIDYLKRMSVFEDGESGFQIGNSLKQFNIGKFTSMGEEVDNDIEKLLTGIMNRCSEEGMPIFDTSYYTNVFFINDRSKEEIVKTCKQSVTYLEGLVNRLASEDGRRDWRNHDIDDSFTDCYFQMERWLVKGAFWDDFADTTEFSREEFEQLERVIANCQLLADSLFINIRLKDSGTFLDISGNYRDPSWGYGVLDIDYLDGVLGIYKQKNVAESEKETAMLELSKQLLQSLQLN